jgi:hypothetical protein
MGGDAFIIWVIEHFETCARFHLRADWLGWEGFCAQHPDADVPLERLRTYTCWCGQDACALNQ